MSPKSLLINILLLTLCTNLFAQISEQDSIAYKKAYYFKYDDADSLRFYSRQMMKSKDTCFSLEGKLGVATAYYRGGDYTSSESTALNLLEELNSIDNDCALNLKISTLERLFWITKNENRLEEALNYLLEEEKLILQSTTEEDTDFNFKTARFYNCMSLVEMELGYYQTAKEKIANVFQEFEKMEQFDNQYKDENRLFIWASANNILGEIYLNMSETKNDSKLDSASVYFKKAWEISKRFNNIQEGSEDFYQLRIAGVLIKQEKYDEALKLINTYTANQNEKSTSQMINHLKSIAFYKKQQIDSSNYFANRFIKNSKQTPSTAKNRITILNILAENYKELNKLDSAIKYSELARREYDTLSQNKIAAGYSHYLYDFRKVKEVNEQIQEDNENQKKSLWATIIIGLFFGVLVFIYYYNQRKKLEKAIELVDTNGNQNSPKVTEYSIDESLEEEVLEFLEKFEKSNSFLDSGFGIQDLANLSGTNTSYLSSIINKNKEKSFKVYISELRINHLIDILKTDIKLRSYTIQALAEEIGYTNASAFTRAFKKQLGVTPSQYIKDLETS